MSDGTDRFFESYNADWHGSTGDDYCSWLISKGYDPADAEDDRNCREEYRKEMKAKREGESDGR